MCESNRVFDYLSSGDWTGREHSLFFSVLLPYLHADKSEFEHHFRSVQDETERERGIYFDRKPILEEEENVALVGRVKEIIVSSVEMTRKCDDGDGSQDEPRDEVGRY